MIGSCITLARCMYFEQLPWPLKTSKNWKGPPTVCRKDGHQPRSKTWDQQPWKYFLCICFHDILHASTLLFFDICWGAYKSNQDLGEKDQSISINSGKIPALGIEQNWGVLPNRIYSHFLDLEGAILRNPNFDPYPHVTHCIWFWGENFRRANTHKVVGQTSRHSLMHGCRELDPKARQGNIQICAQWKLEL